MSTTAAPRQAAGPPGAGRLSVEPLPLIAAVLAGLAVCALALVAGGAASAASTGLGDPGTVVRWSLPLARVLHDLSASLTLGAFALAAFVLPAGSPAWSRVVRWGGGAAVAWTLSAIAVLVLVYADVAGRPIGDPGFGTELGLFVQEIDLGRSLLVTTVVAALIATAAFGVGTPTGAGMLCAAAAFGLLPMSLGGHAAGSSSHETAVSSLAMHLVGAALWVGGLIALLVVAPGLGKDAAAAVRRYSTVALCAFVLVGASGLVNGAVRIGSLAGLASGYGALLIGKLVALVVLAGFGARYRRSLIPALATAGGRAWQPFARLAAVEVAVMGGAIGLAVALSRTPTPVPDAPADSSVDAAASTVDPVLGYPAPPLLDAGAWFIQWRPDVLWLAVCAVLLGLYVAGLVRLHRRGDAWPPGRAIAFVAGVLVLLYVTNGAPAVYGRVLFSAHMVGHMALSMVVPPLLVLGAPVTLALRTLPSRRDGSRGPREWILVAVHGRPLRVLGHPVVAAGLFSGSLIVFYFSPLFDLALTTHTGHVLMNVHFLLVGYLFASAVIGVDPGPPKPSPPLRLMLLFATMAFHAFFGVALVSGTTLLGGDWFGALGVDRARSLLADQQYGGALAWGIGELPTILLALAVAVQWSREDARTSRREDRAADRDGDAELGAYNARLAAMSERPDPSRPPEDDA